jgi:hypothetical protein
MDCKPIIILVVDP